MMKSYLRYEPRATLGVIASPQCNISYDFSGNLVLTGTVQDVGVWNLRQATQIATLKSEQPNYPHSLSGEVVTLQRNPEDKATVACGYTTGDVRIFNYVTKSIVATLRGHKTSVIYLAYSGTGADDKSRVETSAGNPLLLASCGADSNIVVWDVMTLTAMCKLRGHKDAVTACCFINRGSQQLLVSASKDTLIMVWDVSTQYCIQTIVGHRAEIWSLAVHPTGDFIVTGCSDDLIRGYRLKPEDSSSSSSSSSYSSSSSSSSSFDRVLIGDSEKVLELQGCIKRSVANSSDKCSGLYFNSTGTLMAIQSSAKLIDIYRVRDQSEAKKKMKRRLRRLREKKEKQSEKLAAAAAGGAATTTSIYSSWEDAPMAENEGTLLDQREDFQSDSPDIILSDSVEHHCSIRTTVKVRGFAFSPTASKDGTWKCCVSLLSNLIETYSIPQPDASKKDDAVDANQTSGMSSTKTSIVEIHGHRSDVRSVSLSTDGMYVTTCSSEGIKVWSTRSQLCIRSCATGYGLCVAFAPGARYVIVGTKEGHIQIADTSSGELVSDQQEHEGSVWSLAVRPDGKGFVSGGADKEVKFYHFSVSGSTIAATLYRKMTMSHDVLCVAYSPTKVADKLMVAVGLLDSTIKIFYEDSLKFFLSLYGHKLPVMCLDISYDCNIIVTGSADKTIKIWGLDFGDCHRSLIAHTDSVTCIKFQNETHYFFSGSKDGSIKYWDADRFEQILYLPGHSSCVWGLDVSFDGALCVSVGQDRTVRFWERGEDLVFVEEEKERQREALVDKAAEMQDNSASGALLGANAGENTSGAVGEVAVAVKSIESIRSGEVLMDAIDLVEAELADIEEFNKRQQKKKQFFKQSDQEASESTSSLSNPSQVSA